jgi:hypothetical protein
MKLANILLGLAAFTAGVQAQNPLASLAEHMPKCAVCLSDYRMSDVESNPYIQLACFMEVIPTSTCATNLTSACLCTNTALNAAVGVCSQKTCTKYELLRKMILSLRNVASGD